jgi:hypothetical protein
MHESWEPHHTVQNHVGAYAKCMAKSKMHAKNDRTEILCQTLTHNSKMQALMSITALSKQCRILLLHLFTFMGYFFDVIKGEFIKKMKKIEFRLL